MAVSSAQHQNAPPAGSSHPDDGGVGVGGVSAAEDISSALHQHAAATARLEQVDATAGEAEAAKIGLNAVATAPSVNVKVVVPPAEPTRAVRSGEPAGVDKVSALSAESKSKSSLRDSGAALPSSRSGVSPTMEREKGQEQEKTDESESVPWAFAPAAAESEARVAPGMVREIISDVNT